MLRRAQSGVAYQAVYAAAREAYDRNDWQAAEQQFSRAATMAVTLRVSSDAASWAADARTKRVTRDTVETRMMRLLAICKEKRSPYACLAACDFYANSSPHRFYAEKIRLCREEAQIALAG